MALTLYGLLLFLGELPGTDRGRRRVCSLRRIADRRCECRAAKGRLSRADPVHLFARECPTEGSGVVLGLAEVLCARDRYDPFTAGRQPVKRHPSDRGAVVPGHVGHFLEQRLSASRRMGWGLEKRRRNRGGRSGDSRNGSSCITRITILTLEEGRTRRRGTCAGQDTLQQRHEGDHRDVQLLAGSSMPFRSARDDASLGHKLNPVMLDRVRERTAASVSSCRLLNRSPCLTGRGMSP